ncbi:MAG: hypothetical protein H6Q25_510 [Bacteroidetes bacterium]|nr:hypothetical protein [Bacteroidota bacterium]
MRKFLLFFLFISFSFLINAQILITSSQVNAINTAQSAAEGDIYKDTENNIFYIGTSSGFLKIIGDISKVNATLTGDGSAGNPLGIAPMGASNGQVLSWNGTTWVPVNAAPSTTTVSNSIASGQLTTTVNGVSATAVTLPTADGSETKLSNGTNTTVTGAGTIASPYTVSVADATTSAKGVVQLAGDLTGTATSPQITANAVTTAEINNGTILNEDISDNTIATGKILDGTIATADLGNAQVTYAKIQNVTAQRILGNPTASAAAPSEISLGSGLNFSGSVLNTVNNGTVTTVTGTSPIVITGTPTSTPNVTITRNNIVAGTSLSSASNPLVLDAGATNAVVGGANATLTVNNTAPLWNANQLQTNPISATAPTNGQVLSWNGTAWTPTSTSTGWSLTGNSGTAPATNFLGTTDAQRLVFRTNNTEKMTILSAGNVGIGATNPQNKLEITQGTAGNSGLRFTNLTNAGILATNANGDVIVGNDIKDHHITRANSTSNVAPTSGEISNPVNGYTAKIKLTNGIIEYWTYTSGSWTLNWSQNATADGIDLGYIVGWTSNGTPPDYLLPLTGGTYNWSDFPHFQSFHASFPCQYIASSNASTFTLVNINTSGRFLRGGTSAGVLQGYSTALPINPFVLSNSTHNHNYINTTYSFTNQRLYNTVDGDVLTYSSETTSNLTTNDNTHTHTFSGGDVETRPINASVIWCIKVKPTSTTGNITINNNTLTETVTNLSQNTSTGQISYTNENNVTQTANVVSTNTNNSVQVGTDGGAYYQKKVFEAYDNTVTTQSISATATTLNINTIRTNLGSIYSLNNDEITISEDGIYRISYTAGLYYTGNTNNINGQFWLEVNSTFYNGTQLYIGSKNTTYSTAAKSVIIQLNNGDVIRVRHQRINGINLNTIPQCSSINIEKLN